MTPFVAILTLTLTAPVASQGMDGVKALEHLPLPALGGPVSLQIRSLEGILVLEAPRAPQKLFLAVQKAPRSLCPGLDRTSLGVRLSCRSKRLVARIAATPTGHLVTIQESNGLPWSGEDAPPFVPLVVARRGEERCPGTTPEREAECMMEQGRRASARKLFNLVALAQSSDLAFLRLGDLAHGAGDMGSALASWNRVRGEPWTRLAAVRRCELSWSCIGKPGVESIYASEGLPLPLAQEMKLRRARTIAFLDRPLEALRELLQESGNDSPCNAHPELCRRIATVALAHPGSDGLEALLHWLQIPERDRGAGAYENALAAAGIAEKQGAPHFAANILAAAVTHVPPRALSEHLLRTIEDYLASEDTVRAEVVLRFARTRFRNLKGPRWAAVTKGVQLQPARLPPFPVPDVGEELAAADRVVQAVRAATGGRP